MKTASFPVATKGMRRCIKSKALSFERCAVTTGFIMLFDYQDLHACFGKITATDKTADACAYNYNIICLSAKL